MFMADCLYELKNTTAEQHFEAENKRLKAQLEIYMNDNYEVRMISQNLSRRIEAMERQLLLSSQSNCPQHSPAQINPFAGTSCNQYRQSPSMSQEDLEPLTNQIHSNYGSGAVKQSPKVANVKKYYPAPAIFDIDQLSDINGPQEDGSSELDRTTIGDDQSKSSSDVSILHKMNGEALVKIEQDKMLRTIKDSHDSLKTVIKSESGFQSDEEQSVSQTDFEAIERDVRAMQNDNTEIAKTTSSGVFEENLFIIKSESDESQIVV